MIKIVATLLRGRAQDAAEVVVEAHALPLLRQQIRDCAAGVEAARQAVALTMAQAEREKAATERLKAQHADLEARAIAALGKGREDLAAEAAATIAQIEAELDTSARALSAYDAEIARLRRLVSDSEARLRDLQRGQRLAVAVEQTQRLRSLTPGLASAGLSEAEATLARLQERQARAEATQRALAELSAGSSAEAMRDRLAAAGCGAALRPDAAMVLERLRARSARPE